jgi:hypothetical protein
MNDKKKVCGEIARRYQKAGKKGRGKLLDGHTASLGYNRDYLAHILSNRGKKLYVRTGGKTVQIIAAPAPQRGRKDRKTASSGRKRGRKPQYWSEAFTALLEDIWDLFDRLCGKLLAPMLRLMPDFLTAEYALTPVEYDLPASVSPRAIDRILKPVKDKGRLRGLSLTKPGTLLRNQILVRVMFNGDKRKPGFFGFDRAAHCGADASGQFRQTLTGTDAGSGWTGEHALLNSAHRWVRSPCWVLTATTAAGGAVQSGRAQVGDGRGAAVIPNSKKMLYSPHGTGNHQGTPEGPARSGGGTAGYPGCQ